MKILVTGKNGQVAQAMLEQAGDGIEIIALGRPELDITNKSSVAKAVFTHKPDIIVNAAAYTAVDKAESEVELAFKVNRDGARNVAEIAKDNGLPIIHISTDYVFNGQKEDGYKEDDAPGPLNIYGLSKLESEQVIKKINPNHIIIRTEWIYSEYGLNFVLRMLELAQTCDEIRVVCDQWGTPTSAGFIAENIIKVAQQILSKVPPKNWCGIFHLVPEGKISRLDFSKEIISYAEAHGLKKTKIKPITSDAYEVLAARPRYSSLNTDKFYNTFKLPRVSWKDDLNAVIKKILQKKDDIIGAPALQSKSSTKLHVLVTGGFGYIGRHVLQALHKENVKVSIAANHVNSEKSEFGDILPFNVFEYNENIFNDTGCPDIVINLAWKDGFFHNNLSHYTFANAQFHFINNMLKGGLKHIATTGTMHEIGYYVGAVDENTPTNPFNNYGIAKNYVQRIQYQLCKRYNAINQWLRCYYITGDDEKSNSVFNKILKAEHDKQKEFPMTDGEVLFDFIDVNLLGEYIVKVSLQNNIDGIINCSSGAPVSLKSKITEFLTTNHLKIKPAWGKFPKRPYDSRAIWGDTSKLAKILNTK